MYQRQFLYSKTKINYVCSSLLTLLFEHVTFRTSASHVKNEEGLPPWMVDNILAFDHGGPGSIAGKDFNLSPGCPVSAFFPMSSLAVTLRSASYRFREAHLYVSV